MGTAPVTIHDVANAIRRKQQAEADGRIVDESIITIAVRISASGKKPAKLRMGCCGKVR